MWQQFQGIGNLAADVETRYTQGGKSVCNFTVCCDSGYGDNKRTEYVKCVAWGKLADVCGEYLSKGIRVFVQGTMQTRKWSDQQGKDRYSTEIVVQEMKMLSSRKQHSNTDQYSRPDVETPF